MVIWGIALAIIYFFKIEPLWVYAVFTVVEFFNGFSLNRKYVTERDFKIFLDEEGLWRTSNSFEAFINGIKISFRYFIASLMVLPLSLIYRAVVGWILYQNYYFFTYKEICGFVLILTLLCMFAELLGRTFDILSRLKK